MVGLDILGHVVRNAATNIKDERSDLKLPDFFTAMLERKWLGDKTKGGFYKKQKSPEGEQRFALDWKTLEYRPAQQAEVPCAGDGEERRGPARAPAHAAGAVERQGRHLPVDGALRPVDLRRQPHWRDCRLRRRNRSRHEARLQLGDGAVRAVGCGRRRQDRRSA